MATTKKLTFKEFRAWRKKKGMTQQEAADFLFLSIATIRAYEANPRRNEKARKVPVYMQKYLEALETSEELKVRVKHLQSQLREARDPA